MKLLPILTSTALLLAPIAVAAPASADSPALDNIGISPVFVAWEVRNSAVQGYMRFRTFSELCRAAALINPDNTRRLRLHENYIAPWDWVYVGSWALAHTEGSDL